MKGIVRLLAATGRLVANRLGRDAFLIRALQPAYERLLVWLSGGRGLPWCINEVPCLIDPRLRGRFPPEYEVGAAAFLAARVRSGDLCLDIGANVGAYVVQLAHWSRPDGRVIAFEPNPVAADLLLRHIALNKLAGRVQVVRSAVSSEVGNAVMYTSGNDGRSRLGQVNPALVNDTHPVSVAVTTIDDFCTARRIRPDWILIDIEGFEISALRGGRRTLSGSPQPGVVVEMHPSLWKLSGTTRIAAETALRDLGLTVLPLSGQADPFASDGLVYLAPLTKV